MARFEFKLPDIGEGVTEGEIVAWAEGIEVGARVEADQPLVEVMTDKATVTIPSPKAGTIAELGGKLGDVVPVGGMLAVIETEAGAVEQPKAKQAEPAPRQPPKQAEARQDAPKQQPKEPVQQEPAPAAKRSTEPSIPQRQMSERAEQAREGDEDQDKPKSGPSATAAGTIPESLPGMAKPAQDSRQEQASAGEKPLAAPATRQLARELGVDLSQVQGSGPHGRISQDDVRRHTEGGLAAPSGAARGGAAPMRIEPAASEERALEERVPLRGVRKRIFEGMSRSMHTAAHFTFVEECDVTALTEVRDRMRPMAELAGARLAYLPFIVKACVAALKKHPVLNSAFDESTQEIVFRKYYNIGIATATDAGLMVPVVKRADSLSVLDIAREIERLAAAAREGKARREELSGSTFTITSLGAQGGLFATPILNFPEVAILGVHQIKKRPVVRDERIVVGQVMLLSLSFDHRMVDGHVGAAFAYEVIRYLENPDRLMLEMA